MNATAHSLAALFSAVVSVLKYLWCRRHFIDRDTMLRLTLARVIALKNKLQRPYSGLHLGARLDVNLMYRAGQWSAYAVSRLRGQHIVIYFSPKVIEAGERGDFDPRIYKYCAFSKTLVPRAPPPPTSSSARAAKVV